MAAGQRASAISFDYIFDNASEQAAARFNALSEIFDPGTLQHLRDRGVDQGWHCLEVGGGNGSIATWLSPRVGSAGRVLVTDIDTRFLETVNLANVEVRKHNIVTDALPEDGFDLVHSRLVLLHLPEREKALQRMIAALRPGGWLVDEEFDSASMLADPVANPSELFSKTHLAMLRLMDERGVERRYGSLLLGRLRAHGLIAVGAEARVFMWHGGSAGASLLRANFEQLRAPQHRPYLHTDCVWGASDTALRFLDSFREPGHTSTIRPHFSNDNVTGHANSQRMSVRVSLLRDVM
jgi:SAM-dependent methyltransferase